MALAHNFTNESLQQVLHTQMVLDRVAIARSRSKFAMMITMSFFFIYINTIMFVTLWSKPVFRETPRYMLFAHMLCNDSILLFFTSLIGIISLCSTTTKSVCCIIMLVSESTSRNAPLNLAVMSLERYIAICFPLRHSAFATIMNTYVAIALVWFLGLVSPVINAIYTSVTDPDFFTEQLFCGSESMFITTQWQEVFHNALNGFYYVVVMLVIIYSYISVMIVARSVSSDVKSARKAHKTLLLHLIQLLLCLNTLLYGHIIGFLALCLSYEVYYDVRYTIYLLVILLPRCLSPLIYGLRDETLHCLFMYYFKCGVSGDKPIVNIH